MFKLVLHPKRDSYNNTYPGVFIFHKDDNGDLNIDLGDREIVIKNSDIEKLRKLLDI